MPANWFTLLTTGSFLTDKVGAEGLMEKVSMMVVPAEARGERLFPFGDQEPPIKGNPALVVRCEFEPREGWDWAATLEAKGARSAHECLSLPRQVMARELPHRPGFFVLVEKRREWCRRHIVGREEAETVLRNLKKLSEPPGPGRAPRSA